MGKSAKFGLLVALVMAGAMWFYVQRLLIPHQVADAALHSRPRGILSDLYPRWVGTRALLLDHRDPYSAEVTREIQMGYYGRLLDPKRPNDPVDEQRFAYPVFVVFLLAPTVLLPFTVVKAIAEWGFGILTLLGILWWLRALRWRPSRAFIAIFMILTIGNFATVFGLKLQQLSLLVSALIAASAALLVAGQLWIAGFLLALATIKPQLVVPLAGWLILWALSDWKRRVRFFWGFILTEAALILAGEYMLPGWIGRFTNAVVAYSHYTHGGSPLGSLVTTAAMPLEILLVLITVVVGWRLRKAPAGTPPFSLAVAFILTVTTVIVPMVAPYNQLLLLPAVLLIVQGWKDLWRGSAASRVVCILTMTMMLWPWAASLGLSLSCVVLPRILVERQWTVPLWTSLAIPITVLALLAFPLNANLKKKPISALGATENNAGSVA